ncbi:unnamed protein product [Symbiodinium sp. CCMP2592]|nr:unnamed protein product [Symbiodinium sp. CCMP2592]
MATRAGLVFVAFAAGTYARNECSAEETRLLQIARARTLTNADGSLPGDMSGDARQNEYWQCDRMCRYVYGFFDRYIVGTWVKDPNGVKQKSCLCKRGATELGNASFAETRYRTLSPTGISGRKGVFQYAVPYNTSNYWSGAEGAYTDGPPIYSTRMVCAISSMSDMSARPVTYAAVDDVPVGHCASLWHLRRLQLSVRSAHHLPYSKQHH